MTDLEHNPVVADTGDEITYCEVHPDRETALRCNRCGRYMCVQCAVQTSVGYRCQECVHQHEDKFFDAGQADYVIIFTVCAVLAGIGGLLVQALNMWLLFILLVALPLGGFIGELAQRSTQRRRGRHSDFIAAAGAAIGGIIGGAIQLYFAYNHMLNDWISAYYGSREAVPPDTLEFIRMQVMNDQSLLTLLLFAGLVAAAVYGRFQVRI